MLSTVEKNVLGRFQTYQMTAEQMLCFHGPEQEKFGTALQTLIKKKLLEKEQFPGGYRLTRSGFRAMRNLHLPKSVAE